MKNYVVAEYNVANQIIQDIEYNQRNRGDYQTCYCSDDDDRELELITDEEIEEYFWNEYDREIYWESFEMDIEIEFSKHIGKEVYVEGKNMGWRNRSGHKTFTLNEPMDMFREIAPECDLTFKIEKIKEKEYQATISHHDSPMGEYYNIKIK